MSAMPPVRIVKQIAFLIAMLVFASGVIWIGIRFFQPVEVPPAPPARSPVAFNPESDIRHNALFGTLEIFAEQLPSIDQIVIGKEFPFAGEDSGDPSQATDRVLRLATMEPVLIPDGGVVQDIARDPDGELIALSYTVNDGGSLQYTLWSFDQTVSSTALVTWQAEPVSSLRVAAMDRDSQGVIWLLNEAGGIGMAEPDGGVVWEDQISTGLSGSSNSSRVFIDITDRVWISDGTVVAVGGKNGFSPVDFVQQLSDVSKRTLTEFIEILPSEYQPMPLEGSDGLLRSALKPDRFFQLRDGRTGVTTGYGVLLFGYSLANKPTWIGTLATSTLPIAIAPNGDIWGNRYKDGALIRMDQGGMEGSVFMSETSVPRLARQDTDLFGFGFEKMYALDYLSATSTYLWSTFDESWTNQIVTTSGTILGRSAEKVEVDARGNVWSVLSGGHLVRIRDGAEIIDPRQAQD